VLSPSVIFCSYDSVRQSDDLARSVLFLEVFGVNVLVIRYKLGADSVVFETRVLSEGRESDPWFRSSI
jgi:hypothetical protein